MLKVDLRVPPHNALCFPPDPGRISRRRAARASTVRGTRLTGLLFALLALMICAQSAPAAGLPALNRKLAAAVDRSLPRDFAISIRIIDLESGRVLMEKNPDLALIPASTMKLVTSYAALSTLKPDFRFITTVSADGVKDRSVETVYLKGGGDPYMVSEQLFKLTRDLRNAGLREIRGNIVVDDSFFTPSPPIDEHQELSARSYHAPYGALSLNFNSVKLIIHPARLPGRPARVIVDPLSEYTVVKGAVQTIQGRRRARIPTPETTLTDDGRREIIQLKGSIGVSAPPEGEYVNVARPALYTGEVFKEFLLREGIRVTGKVMEGRAPDSAEPLLEFESKPLAVIVYWLNKFSSNFMAEQINHTLGAYVHGPPGTREKGLAVLQRRLTELGIDPKTYRLREASGLSRGNRLSAAALTRVLYAAARDFSFNAEFVASLGVAGVDGTLKNKLTDGDARRRIRAKTGNLRGVTALAGYGISPGGREFAFAVLVNSLKNGVGFIDYGERIMRAVLDMPLGDALSDSGDGDSKRFTAGNSERSDRRSVPRKRRFSTDW